MVEEVLSVITKWQSNERLTLLDEAKIKQVVILPIFRGLLWDPDNDHEVCPEYPVEDKWVDYALLTDNKPKVFIEAKKGGEALEKHEEKLLMDYACREGVKIAVLTNGATWWFYLPLLDVIWEQRKFHTLEFDKQNADEIAQKFVDLLSKENVCSITAIQNAEDLYRKLKIEEALPKAWNQLVNGTIVDLLVTRTEGLCGHKPDRATVEQFLSTHLQQMQIMPHPTTPAPVPSLKPDPSPGPSPSGSVTGKKPVAFTFNGSRYEVSSWPKMIVKFCEIVHSAHSNRFDEVLNLRGRHGRTYFSKNRNELRKPQQISGTDIFVTATGQQSIKRIADELIAHFGYDKSELSYEIRTFEIRTL